MNKPSWRVYGWLGVLLFLGSPVSEAARGEVSIGPLRIGNGGSGSVSVGRDLEVKEGESQREAVVVAGDAIINGTIDGGLVVILGKVTLGPSAEIRSDLVVIGGSLERAPTAVVGGEPVLLGLDGELGEVWTARAQEWFLSGLLLLRPLPHGAGWAWLIALGFLLLYALLVLLVPRPVQASVSALNTHPVSCFLAGLLSFLLVGPLLFLLVVSVVGWVVVPFLVAALVTAYLFGKAAICEYTGLQMGKQAGVDVSARPLVALVAGGLLIGLLHAVPLIGFLVWSGLGTLGFGAAMMAVFRSLRSEQPAPVRVPSAVVAPVGAAEAALGIPPGADSVEMIRAGFWIRAMATAIDLLLVGAVLSVMAPGSGRSFFPLVWLGYHFALWTWRGTTIGGLAMGIRIIRTDGRLMDYSVALIRCLSAIFSAACLMLGFFWVAWDREKRSWHDKIAGTIVVRWPR